MALLLPDNLGRALLNENGGHRPGEYEIDRLQRLTVEVVNLNPTIERLTVIRDVLLSEIAQGYSPINRQVIIDAANHAITNHPDSR